MIGVYLFEPPPEFSQNRLHLLNGWHPSKLSGQPIGVQEVLDPVTELDVWKTFVLGNTQVNLINVHWGTETSGIQDPMNTNLSILWPNTGKGHQSWASIRIQSHLCTGELDQVLAWGLGGQNTRG